MFSLLFKHTSGTGYTRCPAGTVHSHVAVPVGVAQHVDVGVPEVVLD